MAKACEALGVPFVAVIPTNDHEQQAAAWPAPARLRYRALLIAAAWVDHGPKLDEYKNSFNDLLKARNRRIVAQSERLYALWDGSVGGTGHCVRHAMSERKIVENVWPSWLAWREAYA